LTKGFRREILSHFGAETDLDSHFVEDREIFFDNLLRQPIGREAMSQEASQFVSGFKKGDSIAQFPEIEGRYQPGWTSTNNSNFLIPLLGWCELEHRFLDMIDEESFQMANGDRAILFDSLTLPLAGVRAGIGENSWKREFLSDQCKGLFKFALRDESDISLGITVEGTGCRAGGYSFTVDRILERHGLREWNVDGLSSSKPHIEFIGQRNRALSYTISTRCAFSDINITRFLSEDYLEISGLAFDMNDLGVGD
jgi:hypothetical protein